MILGLRRSSWGYSLLEIMVALCLLVIACLGLVSLAGAGLKMQSAGQEKVFATELGNAFMERVRGDGYLTIPASDRSFDGRVPDPEVDEFPPDPYPAPTDAPEYQLLVETQTMASNLRRVRVTVFSPTTVTRMESYFHP